MGTGFCPSRIKSGHFSSGCVVLHNGIGTADLHVSIIALKGNEI